MIFPKRFFLQNKVLNKLSADTNEIEVLEQHVMSLVKSHKKLQKENAALRSRLLESLNQQQALQAKNNEAMERIHTIINTLQVAARLAHR